MSLMFKNRKSDFLNYNNDLFTAMAAFVLRKIQDS